VGSNAAAEHTKHTGAPRALNTPAHTLPYDDGAELVLELRLS
jgi:hypothetical protein